jgi:hypothetical protein
VFTANSDAYQALHGDGAMIIHVTPSASGGPGIAELFVRDNWSNWTSESTAVFLSLNTFTPAHVEFGLVGGSSGGVAYVSNSPIWLKLTRQGSTDSITRDGMRHQRSIRAS